MVTLESGLDADVNDLDTIFESSLSTDAKKFWLNVAYSWLNDRLDWSKFTTAKKARMEAIAAADAASSQDPRVARDVIGDSEMRYQRDPNTTDYYQMLLALDHTNTLAQEKDAGGADIETFGPGR